MPRLARVRFNTLFGRLFFSLATGSLFYWFWTRYIGFPEAAQRQVAMLVGVGAVAGGTWWMGLMSSAKMKAELRNRQLSAWASLLGPLGGVLFLSGFILLFWVAQHPVLTRVATAGAVACGALSILLRLRGHSQK